MSQETDYLIRPAGTTFEEEEFFLLLRMDRYDPKHVELTPEYHIAYLVGMYIYCKKIHGPSTVKSILFSRE